VPARVAVDPRYTVRDLLDFYAVLHGGHDRVWVETLIDRFSADPGSRIGRLNPPFRRRIVGITVAVAYRTGLLIFDQPAEPAPPSLRASLHQLLGELTGWVFAPLPAFWIVRAWSHPSLAVAAGGLFCAGFWLLALTPLALRRLDR
jgi:hypothetical protein